MKIERRLTLTFGIGLALSVCLGSSSGSAAVASADQATTLAESVAHQFNQTQISALIAAAAGHTAPGADDAAPLLAQLRQALDVNDAVAVALLRIFDHQDFETERLIKDLAQSAALYHGVTDDLASMNLDDPDGQSMIAQAAAAMSGGRFGDAEAQIRQFEDLEASADKSPAGNTAPDTSEHRFAAAQARTLLGKIALMRLQYGKATEDFQLARQRLAMAPLAQPTATDLRPANSPPAAEAPEAPNETAVDTAVTKPQDGATVTPIPTVAAPTVAVPIVAAIVPPVATTSTTPGDGQKFAAPPPVTEAAAKPAVVSLPMDMLELLLRRGDAVFALGDIAAARLLYGRAAAAGDGRGATGVGKTYDPRILSQIGARGIRADAAAAAAWYQKAVALGDTSAAARLKLLGQTNGQ
jgi:TPR repeat protein